MNFDNKRLEELKRNSQALNNSKQLFEKASNQIALLYRNVKNQINDQ